MTINGNSRKYSRCISLQLMISHAKVKRFSFNVKVFLTITTIIFHKVHTSLIMAFSLYHIVKQIWSLLTSIAMTIFHNFKEISNDYIA